MNIQEYIASGILESYVLGQTSDSENALISCLIKTNPLVAQEISEIQKAIEFTTLENSIEVPSELKSEIWAEIQKEGLETPIFNLDVDKSEASASSQANEIITLRPSKQLWIGLAASILALVSFAILSLYYMNLSTQYSSELKITKNTKDELSKNLVEKENQILFLSNSTTKKIILNGVENKENLRVVAHWNQGSKKLVLSEIKLPAIPSDKQYQLWALLDGKPIDAGVLNSIDEKDFLDMKSISNSQAFAITIEKKGGSETPSLEDLCVIGDVK
jgi:anti-sigma-K factor RskA